MTQPAKKKLTKEELKKKVAEQRERDAELVTGIFKNLENPRTSLKFTYKKWPGEPLETYDLMCGERYQLKRGVAKHLNTACFFKEYKMLDAESGNNTKIQQAYDSVENGRYNQQHAQAATKIYRFAFHSLEFMDEDLDMKNANLTEVAFI